jgi:hypothetical protein
MQAAGGCHRQAVRVLGFAVGCASRQLAQRGAAGVLRERATVASQAGHGGVRSAVCERSSAPAVSRAALRHGGARVCKRLRCGCIRVRSCTAVRHAVAAAPAVASSSRRSLAGACSTRQHHRM